MDSSAHDADPLWDLLTLGMRLGYLTFEVLNEMIPDEAATAEKMDWLLAEIDRLGIRLVEQADVDGRPAN